MAGVGATEGVGVVVGAAAGDAESHETVGLGLEESVHRQVSGFSVHRVDVVGTGLLHAGNEIVELITGRDVEVGWSVRVGVALRLGFCIMQ